MQKSKGGIAGIASIIVSAAFTLVVSFLIYNYRLVAYYLFGLKVGVLSQHAIARLICYFLFALLIKFKTSDKRKFWTIFLPVLALDSTTLISGRELVPLRFPYDTVYPLLGILCGISLRVSKKSFILLVAFSSVFMIVSHFYIRPSILWYIRERNQPITKKTTVFKDKFLCIDSSVIILSDTLKNQPSVIEFYFVGCMPCEEKYVEIRKLYDEFSVSGIKFVLICAGDASSFPSFKKHNKINKYKNIIFLYDYSKLTQKYKIGGYPTEYISDGYKIVNTDQGFGKSIRDQWLAKERKLYKKILGNDK